MPIINILNATANVAHALFEISTHNWTKKSLITLGITTVVFIGATILIANLESDDEENEPKTEDQNDSHVESDDIRVTVDITP